jgi:methylthioribulose-1-phosphate dehydratase
MIYRIDPEARAVIHVHSPWTLIKARSGKLEFAQQEMQKALGLKTHDAELRIPVFPNTQEMESFARELEGASWDRQGKLFILKDHGVYGWGREPEEAFCRIEALEFLCQTN